jgi:hypothetical protein
MGLASHFPISRGIHRLHQDVDLEGTWKEEDFHFLRLNYKSLFSIGYFAQLLKVLKLSFHSRNENFSFVMKNGYLSTSFENIFELINYIVYVVHKMGVPLSHFAELQDPHTEFGTFIFFIPKFYTKY